MIQALIFSFVSIFILKLSWTSLKNPRSHGFFRFFAFESILMMVCYDLAVWFKNPLSIYQLISWILFIFSVAVVTYSFLLFKRIGRPSGNIENTTSLVQTGIYRYVRHPLYLSLILGSAGVFLKQIDLFTTILFGISLISIYLTAKFEEAENQLKFGVNYTQYIQKTKMFIPFIF